MPAAPRLAPGQDALIGVSALDAPVPFVVSTVQGDRITLSAKRDGDTMTTMRGVDAIRAGDAAHVQYVDRFGVYDIDAPVLRRDDETVVLGVPDDGEPVRRRVYVRLRAPLDATCLMLDPDRNVFTELAASIVDIGGGGAALAVAAIAPPGSTLVCSIALPAGAPIVTVGNVLPADADPRDEDHVERRHVRVQFTLISEAERDRVLSFILDVLARSHAS
jgi:hypothetical protein